MLIDDKHAIEIPKKNTSVYLWPNEKDIWCLPKLQILLTSEFGRILIKSRFHRSQVKLFFQA